MTQLSEPPTDGVAGRSLWGGVWPWVAVGVAVGLVLAQYAFRPLWRDEYWALYFSAPHDPLAVTFAENMTRDVHPPLYFVLLHFWRQISDADLFARLFNVAVIVLGMLAAWALRGPTRRAETTAYFFLCATSFWFVFFAAEARMMVMLYVLCALSVLAARNALDRPQQMIAPAGAFAVIGVLAASIHFFGSLWVASLGAAVGLAFLFQRKVAHFLTWGVASCLAVAPALIWIIAVRPDMNYGAPSELPPFWDNFTYGLNQLLRGVIVKTVFANLLVFIAAGLGFAALWRARHRDPVPTVMLVAIGLTVTISFAIHVGWVSMIKERAYIVIIPALLYVVAAAIQHLTPTQRRAAWMVKWAPLAAALSLPVFYSELFKDRENIGPVRAILAQAPECASQTVVMVLRRSEQGWDYADFMARESLKGSSGAGDITMAALDVLLAQGAQAPATSCPIKAIAIGAPRGERDFHATMRNDLRRVGVDPDALEERVFGEGRTRVFVTRSPTPPSP
jgi:hypothetical protein